MSQIQLNKSDNQSESLPKISRFTLMSDDPSLVMEYLRGRAHLLNQASTEVSLLSSSWFLFTLLFLIVKINNLNVARIVFRSIETITFLIIFYCMRQSQKYEQRTPYLLVGLFYLNCAETLLLTKPEDHDTSTH